MPREIADVVAAANAGDGRNKLALSADVAERAKDDALLIEVASSNWLGAASIASVRVQVEQDDLPIVYFAAGFVVEDGAKLLESAADRAVDVVASAYVPPCDGDVRRATEDFDFARFQVFFTWTLYDASGRETDYANQAEGRNYYLDPYVLPAGFEGTLEVVVSSQDTDQTNAASMDIVVPRRDPIALVDGCLLYTSPSPRDGLLSRMPSSA